MRNGTYLVTKKALFKSIHSVSSLLLQQIFLWWLHQKQPSTDVLYIMIIAQLDWMNKGNQRILKWKSQWTVYQTGVSHKLPMANVQHVNLNSTSSFLCFSFFSSVFLFKASSPMRASSCRSLSLRSAGPSPNKPINIHRSRDFHIYWCSINWLICICVCVYWVITYFF